MLNPICHLLALLGVHHIFHVSGLRVNYYRVELFESGTYCLSPPSSLMRLIFVSAVGRRVKSTNERWVHETDCSPAFWMLQHAYRNLNINTDEQHVSLLHTNCRVNQGWRRLFRPYIVNCDKCFIAVLQICLWNIKLIIEINLTVNNFSSFSPIKMP